MAKKKKVGDKDKKIRDLIFVACLFIGLGLGMLYGNVAVGVLIGLGCGFLGMFITMLALRKR